LEEKAVLLVIYSAVGWGNHFQVHVVSELSARASKDAAKLMPVSRCVAAKRLLPVSCRRGQSDDHARAFPNCKRDLANAIPPRENLELKLAPAHQLTQTSARLRASPRDSF